MTIEIRELTVKSIVTTQPKASALKAEERERMKQEILEECRRMMKAMLRSEGER
jgi:hypothetical protein